MSADKGGSKGGMKEEQSPLAKVARDGTLLAAERIKVQAGQVIKDLLFNFRAGLNSTITENTDAVPMEQ